MTRIFISHLRSLPHLLVDCPHSCRAGFVTLRVPLLQAQALIEELDHRGVCAAQVDSSAIRFSLGRSTTLSDIEQACEALALALIQLFAGQCRHRSVA